MGKKEKLANQYIELKKEFDGDEFNEVLAENQIWYLTKNFKVVDIENKIIAVKKLITAKKNRLKKEAYYATPAGMEYKKNLEDKMDEYLKIKKTINDQLHNYVENVIGNILGDAWTTKVSMGYRSVYIEIGLKAIDTERIGKFTFEFGQSFEIHWDGYGFGKQNPTLEMNVGTTGAFNLFGDGIRTEFYRGVATIANNKEFLQDLMAHITIADGKAREISKLYDECKNKLDNPILP